MQGNSKYDLVVGVYHADGGVLGQLEYVVKKGLGMTKCSLCALTHSGVSMKNSWKQCEKSSQVAMKMIHINEQKEINPILQKLTKDKTPCVLGRIKGKPDQFQFLYTAKQLDDLKGETKTFIPELKKKIQS